MAIAATFPSPNPSGIEGRPQPAVAARRRAPREPGISSPTRKTLSASSQSIGVSGSHRLPMTSRCVLIELTVTCIRANYQNCQERNQEHDQFASRRVRGLRRYCGIQADRQPAAPWAQPDRHLLANGRLRRKAPGLLHDAVPGSVLTVPISSAWRICRLRRSCRRSLVTTGSLVTTDLRGLVVSCPMVRTASKHQACLRETHLLISFDWFKLQRADRLVNMPIWLAGRGAACVSCERTSSNDSSRRTAAASFCAIPNG